MEPAEAVLRFLAGVGKGSEAEFYLRLFRARARESFAALVVDAETMRENADGVALDLRLLHTLSLTPVVVLGFYSDGDAQRSAAHLHTRLQAMGTASVSIPVDGRAAAIASAAASGTIPLVCLDAGDLVGLAEMLTELKTHKLIFLRSDGGFSLDGQALSVINLSAEFGALVARPEWSEAQRELLAYSRRLVFELVPHELLVTLTAPMSLLHELFTVKGAGTLLRRGAQVLRHEGLEGVDTDRLRGLLESSFGKLPREHVLSRGYAVSYVESRYRGAALVMSTRLGSYLSKFAVTREAQGEGIGRDLWQALIAEHPVLFWRARSHNAIRGWYEKQCDGLVRVKEWTVFFKGLAPERIPEAIGFALAQPLDF
jgi:acetylglutamate synthase